MGAMWSCKFMNPLNCKVTFKHFSGVSSPQFIVRIFTVKYQDPYQLDKFYASVIK